MTDTWFDLLHLLHAWRQPGMVMTWRVMPIEGREHLVPRHGDVAFATVQS